MRRSAWLFVLLLVPTVAQAKLELVATQAAYGPCWSERTTLDYYPPEDVIYCRFAVTGLKVKDRDQIDVGIASTLTDAHGKVVLSNGRSVAGTFALLGRGPRWFDVALQITSPLPAGEYSFRTTFTDKLAGESVNFARKVRMSPGEFGIRFVQFFSDPDRKVPAPPKTQLGLALYPRINIVGIQLKDGKADLATKVETIDAQTHEVLGVFDVPLQDPSVARGGACNLDLLVPGINGTGRIILRLTSTDRIANKTLRREIPVEVFGP